MRGIPLAAVAIRAGSPPSERGGPPPAGSCSRLSPPATPVEVDRLTTVHPPKPPLAGLEAANRLQKIQLLKVGPVDVHEVELCVGGLPQQEVAEPVFPSGADQQIRVGEVGSKQTALDLVFVDVLRREPALGRFPREVRRRWTSCSSMSSGASRRSAASRARRRAASAISLRPP